MTKILFLLLLFSQSLFADNSDITNADTPVLNTYVPDHHRVIDFYKGYWITTMAFEGMNYEVPFDPYDGEKKDFGPRDQELYGGRIGFGRELYLGGGLMTTTKVEGYFNGTLFSRTLNGGSVDADVKFAFTKVTGQVYGFEAAQALSKIFVMKTKNPVMGDWSRIAVEPFIEAGIGWASAFNKLNYKYSLPDAGIDEAYKMKIEDQILNTRLSIGVNFTAENGYFFFLKVSQNRYDIVDRDATKTTVSNGLISTSQPKISDKIDPVLSYNLGGGYKF